MRGNKAEAFRKQAQRPFPNKISGSRSTRDYHDSADYVKLKAGHFKLMTVFHKRIYKEKHCVMNASASVPALYRRLLCTGWRRLRSGGEGQGKDHQSQDEIREGELIGNLLCGSAEQPREVHIGFRQR